MRFLDALSPSFEAVTMYPYQLEDGQAAVCYTRVIQEAWYWGSDDDYIGDMDDSIGDMEL